MREDGRSKDECAQGVFDRLLILCDFCWWADVSMACGKADPRWRPVRKREPKWHSKGAGLTSARESRYVKRNGGRGEDEEEGSFTREGRAEEEDAWSVEHLGTGRQRRWWWWWW
jgi:hypothetical protein